MKKLSSFSVNYPVSVLMLVLAVILLGTISFQKLGVDLFPDLNNPRLFVDIEAGELPPEEIEGQFVEGIESVALRQKKAVKISSSSRTGKARITVEYSWDADMDEALLDLQKSLTNFTQNSDIEALQVTQQDFNNDPVMLLAFYSSKEQDLDNLRRIAVNYLRNELIRLEGIAAVEITGAEEKELVVDTDPFKMDAYDIDMASIAGRITALNRDMSAGSITEMGRKYVINSKGVFNSIEDFENIILISRKPSSGNEQTSQDAPVLLQDIADVYFQVKDPENIVRLNQKACLGLEIYKESKYNTVKAVDEINSALGGLRKALPGYNLEIINNQADFIQTAIDEVEYSALLGIFLAVIILFVFLRRIGTTMVISIAIPISIIAVFNLMYFNGLTLNIMTLGGLALGAGMLVDNAIVVMESIFRNLESGLSIKEAAVKGTADVSGAITASTITTIIVFLPIVYVHGAAGELFKEQAWTVAFSLLSSLAVAVLVIPMLSSKILKPGSAEKSEKAVHFKKYPKLLDRILSLRRLVIVSALILFIISLILLPVIGSDFMPGSEGGSFKIELKLEEGTAIEHTDEFLKGIEKITAETIGSDLKQLYALAGYSGESSAFSQSGLSGDENAALLHVFLKKERKNSSSFYAAKIRSLLETYPDIEFNVLMEESSLQASLGIDEAPVVVEVSGEDLSELAEITSKAMERIKEIPFLEDVESSFSKGRPQVDLVVDRLRAGLYNISVENISRQVQDLLQGESAGQWETQGEMRDISVKTSPIGLKRLSNLVLKNGTEEFRLDEIADIQISYAQNEILRSGQNRIGRVTAQIKDDLPLNKVIEEIRSKTAAIELPHNYKIEISGEEQKRAESFGSLKFALILSIVLIYMVLASQFESLIHPFTILLTIPLAGTGAILIFFVLGLSLNIMAYIGIIMLVGIAVNDSIILVDAINQLRRDGLEIKGAVIEAGRRRIRPIIMTSLTTVLALLPLTIGFGESASLRAPMALAVIGGLITSTLLTLAVIPCVYMVLDKLRPGQ